MLFKKNKRKRRDLTTYEEEKEIINKKKLFSRKTKKRYKIKKSTIRYIFLVILVSFVMINIIIKILQTSFKYQNKSYNIHNFLNFLNNSTIVNSSKKASLDFKDKSSNISEIEKEKMKKREKVLKNILNYKEKCEQGLLIHNETFSLNFVPKISVVVPIFNRENLLKRTIRSIQNQNMTEIEIIIVDDFSNNKTKRIIEEIKSKDKRIKIINNNKNMGTLYSRCIGVLQSKGIYITTLDSDDIFSGENVFNTIYEEAINTNYDIISFKSLFYYNPNKILDDYFTRIRDNLTVFQPELGIFHMNGSIIPNNIVIWGKLIKNEIFKKAVNMLGEEKYTKYINWNEDTSIFFVVSQVAQSFKFIEKYGIMRFLSIGNSSSGQKKEIKMIGEIFLVEVILDFSKNIDKNRAAKRIKNLKQSNNFVLSNNKTKEYFQKVMTKILRDENIEEYYKNELRKTYNLSY